MKENLSIYYDEEADFLEILTNNFNKSYFKDIEEGISEVIDEQTGKVVGIAIMNFRQRINKLKDTKIFLPVKIKLYS